MNISFVFVIDPNGTLKLHFKVVPAARTFSQNTQCHVVVCIFCVKLIELLLMYKTCHLELCRKVMYLGKFIRCNKHALKSLVQDIPKLVSTNPTLFYRTMANMSKQQQYTYSHQLMYGMLLGTTRLALPLNFYLFVRYWLVQE